MTDQTLQAEFAALYQWWITTVKDCTPDFWERHLRDDLTCTARPFPDLRLNKREFMDAEVALGPVGATLVDFTVHKVGELVLSHAIIKIDDHVSVGDAGGEFPPPAEFSAALAGRTVMYAWSWSRTDGRWQCFDMRCHGAFD